MKETTGIIKTWDELSGKGTIEGDDGKTYDFTQKQWTVPTQPEIQGSVRVICQNGRDASKVEYIYIEKMPQIRIKTYSQEGELLLDEQRRFIGGPWRMRSDALAWMITANNLHSQTYKSEIEDISSLLLEENLLISIRGSVIKYCYGFAIELYLKWILTEAKIEFQENHKLTPLLQKLPAPVLKNLRSKYVTHKDRNQMNFKMMNADVNGVNELNLDWSTFDNFTNNLDNQKFIIGRYASPEIYSLFPSISSNLSLEMNSYMDSNDFFDIGDTILSYIPPLDDYQ
ncbi:MAG: hypothetical protein OXE44_00615 [Nitrospinae bacterium]|nr:hypothetical protein [Nitrospinota bacterium]